IIICTNNSCELALIIYLLIKLYHQINIFNDFIKFIFTSAYWYGAGGARENGKSSNTHRR
ncbi:hypothetical protein D1249_09370, partial [Salmonella enterica]|nr:hypothetical protein [Salmonella enterica]